MFKNKLFLLLLSFILFSIFLTTPVYSISNEGRYNYFLDNGNWSQYTGGLNDSYYQQDLFFNEYDRSFEDLSIGTNLFNSCVGEWCSIKTEGNSGITSHPVISNDYASEGINSLKFTNNLAYQDSLYLLTFGKNEIVGGSKVTLDIKVVVTSHTNRFWYGYITDSNTFVEVGEFNIISNMDWTELSWIIPNGKYRFAFKSLQAYGSGSPPALFYIDNIRVEKNNTGTFRTLEPNTCSNLNSCSNINQHLPNSNLGGVYWVVDYPTGGECNYYIDDELIGEMIEGQQGIYYAYINETISVNVVQDFNLRAVCNKVPFQTKRFFVTPTLFKYHLLNNGDFENEPTGNLINTCSNEWCYVSTGIDARGILNNSENVFDGQKSLQSYIYRSGLNTIYSLNEYSGGDTISATIKTNGVASSNIYLGYVNDANSFTIVENYVSYNSTNWVEFSWVIPEGQYRPAIQHKVDNIVGNPSIIYIDSVISSGKKRESGLLTSNSLIDNAGSVGDLVTFYADYKDDLSGSIIGADCNILVGSTNLSVSYNSSLGKYQGQYGFISSGNYEIVTNCESESYNSQEDSYFINIGLPVEDILSFTPISNVSSYDVETNQVKLNIGNELNDIVFSVMGNDTESSIPFYFYNFKKDVGKNYFVYSSDDGFSWVLDSTISFDGLSANYDEPMQKIWETNKYKYEFYVDVISGETKYYKLVYQSVGKYWETIKNSDEWVHYNNPSSSLKDTKNWDVFSVSELSDLSSQLKRPFSQLQSGDFTRGVYVQFTAYATSEVDLTVQMFGGSDGSQSGVMTIGTTPTRFSILLNPAYSEEDVLKLITNDADSANIYITDYHLIPSSYFVNGMIVLNRDGTILNAISRFGLGSYQYIEEGEPFRIKTSVYDVDGDLERLEVRIYADVGSDVLVGTTSYELSDATKNGEYFEWDLLTDGIIDLAGNYIDPAVLREVFISARLFNNDNLQVAQISKTISLLQYPYFPNDLTLILDPLNNKYGDNPKFDIKFTNAVPEAFIGLRFVFHESGQFDDPVFEKTLYKSDLGCSSLISCQKIITFNEYVYNSTDDIDFVSVEFLVNTEYPLNDPKATSFTNFQALTLKPFNLQIGARTLDTARVLQIFERQYNTYRPDEKIGLVLQLRDVPHKDLTSSIRAEMAINICDSETGGNCVLHDINYLPMSTKYDATTGYTYYYWNNYIVDSSGNLLQDGNWIEPQIILYNLSGEYESYDLFAKFTHANKCQNASYGTFFDWAGFNINFLTNLWSAQERLLFGCTDLTDPIITTSSEQAQRLEIDTNYTRIGGQNHSIICSNKTGSDYVQNLDTKMYCMVFYNFADEQLDAFRFYITNNNSDFSRKGKEIQYIEIEIPANKIIFEDMQTMKKTLEAEFQTDTIDTLGELGFWSFSKVFSGIANPFTEILEGVGTFPTGSWVNTGFDLNWNNTLDPNYINGVFFITIDDLQVINQQDYIRTYPELEDLDPSFFMLWANQNNVRIPLKKAKISILGQDFQTLLNYNPESRLVINSIKENFSETTDINGLPQYVVSVLTFNFISDMISDNFAKNERLFLPIWFTYEIPAPPFNFIEGFINLFWGNPREDPNLSSQEIGLLIDPPKFFMNNWAWLFILGVLILGTSLVYRNLKSGGTTINFNGKKLGER